MGLRSIYRRCRFWQKIIFPDEAPFYLGGYVNKRIVAFGAQKTRTHTFKSRRTNCLVQILIQGLNWAIFLRKWARRGSYSQWRSLLGHVERIFVHKNLRGGYYQHLLSTGWYYVPHSRSYTRCLAPCFWRLHYQPQSWCCLATSELRFDPFYYFWRSYYQPHSWCRFATSVLRFAAVGLLVVRVPPR